MFSIHSPLQLRNAEFTNGWGTSRVSFDSDMFLIPYFIFDFVRIRKTCGSSPGPVDNLECGVPRCQRRFSRPLQPRLWHQPEEDRLCPGGTSRLNIIFIITFIMTIIILRCSVILTITIIFILTPFIFTNLRKIDLPLAQWSSTPSSSSSWSSWSLEIMFYSFKYWIWK